MMKLATINQLLIAVLLLTASTSFSAAQQAQDKASTEAEPTDEVDPLLSPEEKKAVEKAANEAQSKDKEVGRDKKPPKKVFRPTEEISEDSPVPFPVDI